MVGYTNRPLNISNITSSQTYQQQQLNGMSPAGTVAASNPSGGTGSGYAATLAAQGSSNPNQVIAATTADSGGTLQVVNDQTPYFLQVDISDYHRTSWNDVGQFVANTSVILPMPVNIGTRQSVQWDKKKLGLGGAAAISGLNGNLNPFKGVDPSTAAGALIGKTATTFAGGNVVNGGLAYYGLAENSFEVLTMICPTLKEYTFRFELSAKTPQESYNLQSLFNILSGAAAPGLGDGAASMFFTFSKMVMLTFHGPQSTLEGQLFAFKPAVIVDLAWDFAPQGQPSFYAGTGAPESIVLQLSLTELEFWLASDYSVAPNQSALNGITNIATNAAAAAAKAFGIAGAGNATTGQ